MHELRSNALCSSSRGESHKSKPIVACEFGVDMRNGRSLWFPMLIWEVRVLRPSLTRTLLWDAPVVSLDESLIFQVGVETR